MSVLCFVSVVCLTWPGRASCVLESTRVYNVCVTERVCVGAGLLEYDRGKLEDCESPIPVAFAASHQGLVVVRAGGSKLTASDRQKVANIRPHTWLDNL